MREEYDEGLHVAWGASIPGPRPLSGVDTCRRIWLLHSGILMDRMRTWRVLPWYIRCPAGT
jgi:hypothetical protein